MDGDHPHTGRLGAARELRRIDAAIIPAEPHLQRHRHGDGGDGRLDQGQGMVEIAHQGRTRLRAGHMTGRAAHVDVDHRSAVGFSNAGTLGHPARFAAGELDHMQIDAAALGSKQGIATPLDERGTCGHLRNNEPRPQPRS